MFQDTLGAVEKAMFVSCTKMGVTGKRVFEYARVCVWLMKLNTGSSRRLKLPVTPTLL